MQYDKNIRRRLQFPLFWSTRLTSQHNSRRYIDMRCHYTKHLFDQVTQQYIIWKVIAPGTIIFFRYTLSRFSPQRSPSRWELMRATFSIAKRFVFEMCYFTVRNPRHQFLGLETPWLLKSVKPCVKSAFVYLVLLSHLCYTFVVRLYFVIIWYILPTYD